MTMNVQAIDLSKYIEIPDSTFRPHLRGRRIPVATIAYSARSQNWNNAELAEQFSLSEAQVLAALLYYAEHQSEIDEQEAKYQSELDRLYHNHER
jgi:uncharacterized protein (DUF433 family)